MASVIDDPNGKKRIIPKFKKKPVLKTDVPSSQDIARVLQFENTRLFASLLRWTGMAIQDEIEAAIMQHNRNTIQCGGIR